jgi:D-alanyl-D-alanine carboxypeptidase
MAERLGDRVVALVVLNSRDKEARAADMNALRRYAQQALKA